MYHAPLHIQKGHDAMKLIYQNFDKLDVTFQGAVPEDILNKLAQARETAQAEKRDVLAELGAEAMPVMVAETGAKGGYKYRFDTGHDGEIWFIAHSSRRDQWNIRVSVKSLALALYGYEAVKDRLLKRLMALGAKGLPRKDSPNDAMTEAPLESMARFDYCFDFAMDAAFMPLPDRFIAHQRCKKHCHGERGIYSASSGDRVNTVRVGEMPGREATIYDKNNEMLSSAKQYWWDIWGLDRETFKGAVWRVEVRAGKGELDKWNIKRFKDFEAKAGDVVAATLKAIRYTEPLKDDSNRSRWPMHPVWRESLNASFKALAPYSSNASREKIMVDYRQNLINRYREMLIGVLVSYTALQQREISEICDVIEGLRSEIFAIAKTDIAIFSKKAEKAADRFRFLVDV